MEFLEAPAFSRVVSGYLSEDSYLELQLRLAENPELGDLMPGTGGFRKLAWAQRGEKVRRSGLRIVYYPVRSAHQIWLMLIYDENEASDLTAQERRALSAAIQQELLARKEKRRGRNR
jgi:hypothetical protein